MEKYLQKKILYTDIISGLFVLLFVYASFAKLLDYEKFEVEIGKSPLLAPFSPWVPWLIPGLELLISVALCINRIRLIALYLSFSLMVVFSAYIVSIIKFSSYIPCSCGGILENMSWTQHLIFNVFFIGIGAIGILIYPIEQRAISRIEGEAQNLKQSRR